VILEGQSTPQLRSDLQRSQRDDDTVQVTDPVTHRVWNFDELQLEVLDLFDGETPLIDIAAELGGPESLQGVLGLASKVDSLGLTEEASGGYQFWS